MLLHTLNSRFVRTEMRTDLAQARAYADIMLRRDISSCDGAPVLISTFYGYPQLICGEFAVDGETDDLFASEDYKPGD
jgi:hypothetical protein